VDPSHALLSGTEQQPGSPEFVDANTANPSSVSGASLPHVPLGPASSGYVDPAAGGVYATVIEEIDWSLRNRCSTRLNCTPGIDRQTLVAVHQLTTVRGSVRDPRRFGGRSAR